MRIILLSIISLIFMPLLKAQPLMNSLSTPAYSTTITYKAKEDATYNAGSAGEDQTWDFSGIDFTGISSISSVLVNPATTAESSSFMDASFAEETNEGNYIYYDLNNTQKIVLGKRDNQWNRTHIYADPLILIRYPIVYNAAAQTDNYEYTDFLNNEETLKGTITTVYDGYGTIKTPYGTIEDAVRIKTTESGTKEWDANSTHFTDNYTIITYTWYIPEKYIPIFEIKEETNNSYTGQVFIKKTAILYNEQTIPNSTKPRTTPELKITLGPNPASEKISLDFKDVESGTYNISITDYQGVSILNEQKFIGNGELHSLDVSTFNSGFYIVKISSDKAEFVKKLIKY